MVWDMPISCRGDVGTGPACNWPSTSSSAAGWQESCTIAKQTGSTVLQSCPTGSIAVDELGAQMLQAAVLSSSADSGALRTHRTILSYPSRGRLFGCLTDQFMKCGISVHAVSKIVDVIPAL